MKKTQVIRCVRVGVLFLALASKSFSMPLDEENSESIGQQMHAVPGNAISEIFIQNEVPVSRGWCELIKYFFIQFQQFSVEAVDNRLLW